MKHKVGIAAICLLVALLLFIVTNLLIAKYNGQDVPAPEIPRGPQRLGSGPALTYVVMGDSTAIGQGANYEDSYALASAQHLAKSHSVTFVNTGVSGAVAKDIASRQAAEASQYKPDIVLIAVGANDVTHFTNQATIEKSLQQAIDRLRQANPKVQIVVTGSPAMDTVDRFTWPIKQVMFQRVKTVNKTFARLIARNDLIFAPIADKTRDAFKADKTLFAPDKFHPNARGYATWQPVINDALDQAVPK